MRLSTVNVEDLNLTFSVSLLYTTILTLFSTLRDNHFPKRV